MTQRRCQAGHVVLELPYDAGDACPCNWAAAVHWMRVLELRADVQLALARWASPRVGVDA